MSLRSACPSCGTALLTREAIPLVSYIVLAGRCRHCGAAIPREYPVVEALTAAVFAGAALEFEDIWVALMMAPFLGVMVVAAVIDVRHRIIPNLLVYPSLVMFGLLVGLVGAAGRVSVATAWLSLLAYGGGLLLLALVYPQGMGMGDVKLAALIGLVLGAVGWRYVTVAAALAVFGVGLGGLVALLAGRGARDAIPFGPFLAGAAILSALFAPQIADWYSSIR